MPDDTIMTSEELAELLHVPLNTVHYWRSRGTGPIGVRIGKRVIYKRSVVDEWLDRRAASDEMNLRAEARR